MNIELIKKDNRGKTYQSDDFKIFYRNKDTVLGYNSENVEELIYLITGSAGITIEDSTWIANAPEKIEFPAKTYHKIEAVTDISFILYKK